MKLCAFLFLLSLIPRGICLAGHAFLPALFIHAMPAHYWKISESLLRYGILGFDGQKTTGYEPLYPLFLALVRRITGDHLPMALSFQIAAASLGCVYFYKLCFLLTQNKWQAFLASLFYSFDPHLVWLAVKFSDVALFTTLLILSLYSYSRAVKVKGSLLSGFLFGLTLLTRSMVLPLWFFAALIQIFKGRFLNAFVFAVSTFSVLSPLLIRNYSIDGSLLPTRSGLNLLIDNCKYTGRMIPHYQADYLVPYAYQILAKERPDLVKASEKKLDQFFTRKALQYMKENPLQTLKLSLRKFILFFDPRLDLFYPYGQYQVEASSDRDELKITKVRRYAPSFPSMRVWIQRVYSVIYSFILLSALAGFWMRRKEIRQDFLLLSLLLNFTAVYSIYWPLASYRAPLMFVLMFYSAFALK